MRRFHDAYWTTSLPREHTALQTLDAYCKEWGGISRAEATRRLLIEWDKLQQGQPISTWISPALTQPRDSGSPAQRGRTAHTNMTIHPAARAATQALDEGGE